LAGAEGNPGDENALDAGVAVVWLAQSPNELVEVVAGFAVLPDWKPLKRSVAADWVGFAVVVGGAVEDQGSDPNPARPPPAFVFPDAQGLANEDDAGAVGWEALIVGTVLDEVVGVNVLKSWIPDWLGLFACGGGAVVVVFVLAADFERLNASERGNSGNRLVGVYILVFGRGGDVNDGLATGGLLFLIGMVKLVGCAGFGGGGAVVVCPNESFPDVKPPNPDNPPVDVVLVVDVDGDVDGKAEVGRGGLDMGGEANGGDAALGVGANDNPPNAEFKSPRAFCPDGIGGLGTTGVTGADGAGFGA
jgi:hypothetical protein